MNPGLGKSQNPRAQALRTPCPWPRHHPPPILPVAPVAAVLRLLCSLHQQQPASAAAVGDNALAGTDTLHTGTLAAAATAAAVQEAVWYVALPLHR